MVSSNQAQPDFMPEGDKAGTIGPDPHGSPPFFPIPDTKPAGDVIVGGGSGVVLGPDPHGSPPFFPIPDTKPAGDIIVDGGCGTIGPDHSDSSPFYHHDLSMHFF
jgi:hypothetical protein